MAPDPRLLLLGWAAADWRLIQPLLDSGQMPHLESIVTGGVSDNVHTLSPSVPAALWTSIATGRRADAHGVLAATVPDPDRLGVRPAASIDLRVSPLWQILNAAGRRAAAVNWPASHPASVFDGLVVSDAFAEARGEDFDAWPLRAHSVSDPELRETLAELRLHPTEITAEQVLPFIPAAARIDQETDERLPLLVANLARTATVHAAATWIAEHLDWNLLAVHFDLLERLSNAFLQYCAPRRPHVSELDFAIYSEVVDGAYRFMDLLLGRYLALLTPETHILLVSDHGMPIDPVRPSPAAHPVGDPFARRHREFGVLVCSGPGVKQDELVFGANLLDIAPTALTLLRMPVSRQMEGRVLTQIFEEAVEPVYVDGDPAPDFLARAPDWEDRDWTLGRISELVTLGDCAPPGADPSAAAEQATLQCLGNLARVLIAKREHAQALKVLGELLDLAPDHRDALLEVAQCWYALGDTRRCRQALDDVVQSGLRGPAVDFFYGQLCAKEGDPEAARAHLQRAEEAGAGGRRLLERIGRLQLQTQQWVEAEQSFRKALEVDPDFALAHTGLGAALGNQGRHEEAIEHLLCSIGLVYQQPDAHFSLGLSLAAAGHAMPAAQAMRNALAIQPDFAQARDALSRIQQNLTKAMIESAIQTQRAASSADPETNDPETSRTR